MTPYITVEDVEDEVLRDLIQYRDLEAASQQIVDIARSLGVSEESISLPLTNIVQELAVCIACERRAKFTVGTATRSYDGGVDIYECKRRAYAADVKRLTSQITVQSLMGDVSSKGDFAPTIELFRA